MCLAVSAQEVKEVKDEKPSLVKKNIIKINLPALAFKNISVEYERAIGKKTSISLNVHTIPFGKLPFQSIFKDITDNSDVKYDQFKLGSFGVVPELRFYLGKKGALHGFYIGPFVTYNTYKMNLPISYSSGTTTKTGIFDGKLNAVTGGLQIGSQFSLGKNVVLDWWIFGPNYGSANGTLTFAATLTASEQSDLDQTIKDLKDDLPFDAIKSYSVSSTGAVVNVKGPWGGLRGLGLSLGIRL
jgi:hypothetical protein